MKRNLAKKDKVWPAPGLDIAISESNTALLAELSNLDPAVRVFVRSNEVASPEAVRNLTWDRFIV
jgi:hypothetical protein